MKITYLIDRAKLRTDLSSDRALSRELGFADGVVCAWRKDKCLPSDKAIVQLAALAHEDPKFWLLQLIIESADPVAKPIFKQLLDDQKIVVAAE